MPKRHSSFRSIFGLKTASQVFQFLSWMTMRYFFKKAWLISVYLFSSNLAWSKHISDRLKACYIRNISLRICLPPQLHSQFKTKLYKTYILPKLLYGSQLWSPNQKDLSKLEHFQKNVSKWICKGAT